MSPDLARHLDRQREEPYDDDIDWAWADRQADLAEEAARDEYEEARAE
jgi:hypothetical protein